MYTYQISGGEMLAYKALKDILDRTIGWEREFADLLDVAELGLSSEESRRVVKNLKEHQADIIEVITGIDIDAFGPAEWIQFLGDLKRDELIPKRKITRNTSPEEIIAYIRDYETALQAFYNRIADIVTQGSQQDLFLSLVNLKTNQIERLTSL